MRLRRVAEGYTRLQVVTECYIRLQVVTEGYTTLQMVTEGYTRLQEVTSVYGGLYILGLKFGKERVHQLLVINTDVHIITLTVLVTGVVIAYIPCV